MYKKKRNILGVSAGAGVCLFPFKAKSNVVGIIECRSDFYLKGTHHQFKLNFPDAKVGSYIDAQFNDEMPEIIIGNPKCGNSSMLALSRGKAFTSHKDEPSLGLFLDSIQHYKPTIFLMENLPKLLETYSEKDFRKIFSSYRLLFRVFTAAEFGNSQFSRKRLVIIGVHKAYKKSLRIINVLGTYDNIANKISLPTTGKLLENIPSYTTGHFREDTSELITIYSGKKMTWEQIQRLWLSLKPKRHIPTPEENFNTAPGVYINWENDYPLVARKSNRQFNPAGLPMTPRELCRIQGIPDDFKILSDCENFNKKTLINKGRVVAGNTPPYELLVWFKEALEKSGYL